MINHGVVEDGGSGEVTPLMIMRMMLTMIIVVVKD